MMDLHRSHGRGADDAGGDPDIAVVPQKILIVDDRRENLFVLSRVLEALDVEIIEAISGNEALAATCHHHFAVAIIDVMMPEMDGFELATHLRGDKKTGEIPIIFVTAIYPDEQHILSGYKVGGADYIVKPFVPEVLLGKVRVFLELDRAKQALRQRRNQLEALVAERTAELRLANEAQLREIDERRQVESKLRDSEAKMRSIVDNIGIGILLISPEMRILEFNRQMRSWFPELVPEECRLCYRCLNASPKAEKCSDCPTSATFQDGKVHETTARISRPDGIHYYRLISSPIHDDTGRVATVIEMVEDVTERRSLEEQLLQSQKLEAVGQLAGGVAHDFNNMLTVIMGYSEELLGRFQHDDPLRKFASEILMAGQRSAALTRRLLAFSRKQIFQTEVLELNDIIRNLENMLIRLIGEHIELTTVLGSDLGLVEADPHQMEQVIMNLVINARDAMPKGGRLTVETATVELDETHARKHADVTPGQHVLLAVSDTGCGMSEETKKKIFEPFFTTKESGKGSGLGLSTVYGIVKQLGGNIWAYSEMGKGTVFKVFLPLAKAAARAPESRIEPTVTASREVRILLVEDEPILRQMAHSMLSGMGYQVSAVSNGREALAMLEEQGIRPDLIITDVVMPGMSGPELADRIRRGQPGIKVLYMSGYTDSMIDHNELTEPGTPLLQKPFSRRELAAKIAMLLEAGK